MPESPVRNTTLSVCWLDYAVLPASLHEFHIHQSKYFSLKQRQQISRLVRLAASEQPNGLTNYFWVDCWLTAGAKLDARCLVKTYNWVMGVQQ